MAADMLTNCLEAWNRKPGLRMLYGRWFEAVRRELPDVDGPVLEVGSGIGKLKEHIPDLLTLDLAPTCWTDMAGDGQALPVKDESLAAIVAFDVLHHLPRPMRFFREALRSLKPGGRVVIMDPYASPLSRVVFGLFHAEKLDLDCDPFDDRKALCSEDAYDSNQAVATLVFWRGLDSFARVFPGLAVIKRRRLSYLSYALSGGFSGPTLAPAKVLAALAGLEDRLGLLAPLMAFRTLVVIEK